MSLFLKASLVFSTNHHEQREFGEYAFIMLTKYNYYYVSRITVDYTFSFLISTYVVIHAFMRSR